MRRYAPASVEAVLDGLLAEPSLAGGVVHHEVIPAREARTAPLPTRSTRASGGRSRRAGSSRSTPTRPRRSRPSPPARTSPSSRRPRRARRCATRCRRSRRWPTTRPRAPSSCSRPRRSARTRSASSRSSPGQPSWRSRRRPTTATRPAPIRSAIRTAGQVVVTNPDMLHSAILPHHTKWFQLFEQLRIIVVDELHTYRGVFGSHVANVLRRLLRLCAHYGSHPVIVCCSATIGNPAELAELLTGRPSRLIDRNGAPSGERHLLLVEPPLLDPATGARGSALTLAQRWALPFLRAGRQTIVFGRSRVAVEVILTGLREALRESFGPRSRVRGYRGGYLPTERRSIERGLRDGEVLGVVSTNALELGVDVGRLDVSILAGYPGSIAGTWQQIGRAGPAQRDERGRARRLGRPGRPLRRRPPGVPPRECAGGGADRPGQPPRPARPHPGGDVRAARSSRARSSARRRPTTCSRSSPRRAMSGRPATVAGTGRRRTSRPRRSRSGPPLRRTSSSSTRPRTGRG